MQETGDKRIKFTIKEIKQDGIDIDKIIEENGLDGEIVLADVISSIRNAYNNSTFSPTQKDKVEKLGIIKAGELHPYLISLNSVISGKLEMDKMDSYQKNNIRDFVKKHEKKDDLNDEQREIIKKAYEIGLINTEHPYIKLLTEVQEWQKRNGYKKTLPKAKKEYRIMNKEERPEEYGLGKRIENLQNTFLKKYKDYSNEEFENLDEETKEIIIKAASMGIGMKFKLIKRISETFPEQELVIESQDLGKATFTAGVDGQVKLDEAQQVLQEALEIENTKEGKDINI